MASLRRPAGQRQWRLPEREGARTARGRVVGDGAHRQPDQPAGRLTGGGRGGRGQHEHRGRPVQGAQPAQPAQHQGHVAAEQAAVPVALVDHDVAQPAQEGRPALVLRQQRPVQQVGVGQHHVGVLANPVALVERGIAVQGGRPHPGQPEFGQRPVLVGGQRLGGREVQHPGPGLGQYRRQHRQLVGQRLAGRGAGRDHHRLARPGVLGRGHLVRPGCVDPGRGQRREQLRRHPARPLGAHQRPWRQPLDVPQRGLAGWAAGEHVGQQRMVGIDGCSRPVAVRPVAGCLVSVARAGPGAGPYAQPSTSLGQFQPLADTGGGWRDWAGSTGRCAG